MLSFKVAQKRMQIRSSQSGSLELVIHLKTGQQELREGLYKTVWHMDHSAVPSKGVRNSVAM